MDIFMIQFTIPVITQEILKLIAELDEFKGRWQAIVHLAPERLEKLKKIATIESVGSSTRIEGAHLTDDQVEELLSGLETQSFEGRDEQEVAGYADTMEMIFNSYHEISVTENHIRQLHALLLKYSEKDEDHRGEYKKIDNRVEAFGPDGERLGVIFQTATPFETPLMMKKLIDWYQQSSAEEIGHSLILISLFIVTFLAIHPFKDGNGRLSRILTTLLLLRAGYDYVPYSSMEGVIESHKENYYLALRRTQQSIRTSQQQWEPWVVYFLRIMIAQKNNLAAKIKEEQSLRLALPMLSREILNLVKIRGDISVREIEEKIKANRNTIKSHLKQLTEQGHLQILRRGRGSRYTHHG
jgi:Fic family protein